MGVEFFPGRLSRLEFESCQPASFHVGAMLCDPQTRGVKRKFGEEEEGAETGGSPQVFYCHQRQSVFNISMCKLNRFRQAADPCLLRSVLICNTLRCIEREMEREGIKVCCGSHVSSFLPPVNSQLLTLDPPPYTSHTPPPETITVVQAALTATTTTTVLPSYGSMDMELKYLESPAAPLPAETTYGQTAGNGSGNYSAEYDRYLVDLDTSSGRMTPFVRSAYERVESGALWNDDSDRLTSLNWSSVLNFNTSCSVSGGSTACGVGSADDQFDVNGCTSGGGGSSSGDMLPSPEASLHTLMPPSASTGIATLPTLTTSYSSNTAPSPGSSPTSSSSSQSSMVSSTTSSNSSDEIFGDIDLSLYDFDLLSPLSPPNVKLAPVSAEELMRSLSNSSETATASPATTAPFYNKSELFTEERDHVAPVVT